MEHDLYAPPQAVVADVADTEGREYQVVGKTKFFVLYIVTLGMYSLVWMYQHWAQFKRARRDNMWPVARALFQIFFYHSLVAEIDTSLKRANVRSYVWSPRGTATTYVLLSILFYLWNRFSDHLVNAGVGMLVTIAGVVVLAFVAWRIQDAANVACGDAKGESNARFTAGNWVWIVLFGLFWVFMLLGIVALMANPAA
jgi:hypothetical protein